MEEGTDLLLILPDGLHAGLDLLMGVEHDEALQQGQQRAANDDADEFGIGPSSALLLLLEHQEDNGEAVEDDGEGEDGLLQRRGKLAQPALVEHPAEEKCVHVRVIEYYKAMKI